MTFIELAEKVLAQAKRPLTADEIWAIAVKKGFDKALNTKGKTPWATLGAQLYVHARDYPGAPFLAQGTRPKRFHLKGMTVADEAHEPEPVPEVEPPKKKHSFLERDLHPFLAYFAHYYLKAHTKTIRHSKSGKREFGEWLHPDMVGFCWPINDWRPEVIDLGASIGSQSVRLFSFELKRELNFANLREAFFQSVSNSSWANEGYLVAADIAPDEEFQSELRRLSTSFGIGVIALDISDPDSSKILFPARARDALDWETVNKLAINPDFKEFLARIRIDVSSREVRHEKYDKVLTADELIGSIKQAAA